MIFFFVLFFFWLYALQWLYSLLYSEFHSENGKKIQRLTPEVFYKKGCPYSKKKRLYQKCFPVNFTKFFRAHSFQNTFESCLTESSFHKMLWRHILFIPRGLITFLMHRKKLWEKLDPKLFCSKNIYLFIFENSFNIENLK